MPWPLDFAVGPLNCEIQWPGGPLDFFEVGPLKLREPVARMTNRQMAPSEKKDASSEMSDTVDMNHNSIDSHLWPGRLGDELAIPSLFVLIEMGTVSTN